jgi:DNA-binding NtrC family response regulator
MDPSTHVFSPVLPSTMPSARAVVRVVVDGRPAGLVALDGAEPAPLLFGSGPASVIVLDDRTVSRRHCSLELLATSGESTVPALRVVDLGSTNGTYVNGTRIDSGYASHGAQIRVGRTELLVTLTTGTASPLGEEVKFGEFVGGSTEVRKLYPYLRKVVQAALPVLVEGETGTGKEVIAEALHREGARAKGPFVVLDCTTIPAQLAESELFGHEKGAFTGASARKRGAFELADGGTIFIDEIGDLDINLQSKLLRILDRGEYRRVGSEQLRKADVRVIAATRRNLDVQVAQGAFRDDLYHRLVAARIELPPLRNRRGDVAVLVGHFCRQEGVDPATVPGPVLAAWNAYAWPGNARELRLAVRRWVALGEAHGDWGSPTETATESRGNAVETNAPVRAPSTNPTEDFFAEILAAGLTLPEARRRVAEEFEERYVRHALDRARGNVSQAARDSGVARRHFHTLKERNLAALKGDDE